MSAKKSEQIKKYIVIVLFVVMGIIAYFRFIHEKSAPAETTVPSALPTERLDISKILTKRQQRGNWNKQPDPQPLGSLQRDIFTALKFMKEVNVRDELEEEKLEVPTSTWELKGTIIGGGKPMAIIDSQFLKIGDMVGEYELVSIGKKEVWLVSEDEKIKVEMLRNEKK